MPSRHHPPQERGLTLIELIVSITILGILLSIGLPSMAALNQKIEQQKIIDFWRAALRYTRAYAISSSTETTLCLIDQENTCSKQALRLASFIDKDKDRELDEGELLQWHLAPKLMQRFQSQLSLSGGRRFLRFRPNGTAKEFGSLYLCDTTTQVRKSLVVSRLGRLRQRGEDSNC